MAHLPGRTFFRIFLSALALTAFFDPAAAAGGTLTIVTKDGPRSAVVNAAEGRARPTVIYLHGAAMGAARAERTTGMKEAALAHGYNVVFPDGIGRVWNDGRNVRTGADDVGFIKDLATRLVADGVADRKRLYLGGISNGGFMTLRMMCEAPEQFAGFGVVIAGISSERGEECRPRRVGPLVMVGGTADPIVPYNGGSVGFFGRNGNVWGVERTAQLFASANGCKAPQTTAMADGDSSETSITRISWDCRRTSPVVVYRVENGGHQAFAGKALPRLFFGRTTEKFSAAEAIFETFDQAARR